MGKRVASCELRAAEMDRGIVALGYGVSIDTRSVSWFKCRFESLGWTSEIRLLKILWLCERGSKSSQQQSKKDKQASFLTPAARPHWPGWSAAFRPPRSPRPPRKILRQQRRVASIRASACFASDLRVGIGEIVKAQSGTSGSLKSQEWTPAYSGRLPLKLIIANYSVVL